MNLEDYKKRTRKQITLPSGLPLIIKKISVKDAALIGQSSGELNENHIQPLINAICNSVEGDILIVDKESATCGANELSIDEIEGSDFEFLTNELLSFSGFNNGDQEIKKSPTDS